MNTTHLRRLASLTIVLLVLPARANAELALPKVLGDHMVLQRDRPVPVWGRAAAGEAVTVRFAGQRKDARADADGHWRVDLDPLAASAEPRELTISAGGDT